MKTYELAFIEPALAEWKKLDGSIRTQFKKKLAERLTNPHIPSAALHGMSDCYKIKLRKVGYRLIYQVDDNVVVVTVIAVGKRDKNKAYTQADKRLIE
ncbi:type II toxin-antitoxin system RelE family toxin [Stenoxybacter acetivorans]|uniref:type II toxin-antitoxin system RelE family toxin n=1 Tax=Stenoxybacter acetivorans TaxID=422441 RepID=UPI00055F418D|nr:type II toxin-antitoxin system RelE/ParE family toxin [Stenoxybacter acetivorans]